jgi:hypothetical protein
VDPLWGFVRPVLGAGQGFFRLVEADTEAGLIRADDSIGGNVSAHADVRLLASAGAIACAFAVARVVQGKLTNTGGTAGGGQVTCLAVFVGSPIQSESVIVYEARTHHVRASVGTITRTEGADVTPLRLLRGVLVREVIGVEGTLLCHVILSSRAPLTKSNSRASGSPAPSAWLEKRNACQGTAPRPVAYM